MPTVSRAAPCRGRCLGIAAESVRRFKSPYSSFWRLSTSPQRTWIATSSSALSSSACGSRRLRRPRRACWSLRLANSSFQYARSPCCSSTRNLSATGSHAADLCAKVVRSPATHVTAAAAAKAWLTFNCRPGATGMTTFGIRATACAGLLHAGRASTKTKPDAAAAARAST